MNRQQAAWRALCCEIAAGVLACGLALALAVGATSCAPAVPLRCDPLVVDVYDAPEGKVRVRLTCDVTFATDAEYHQCVKALIEGAEVQP